MALGTHNSSFIPKWDEYSAQIAELQIQPITTAYPALINAIQTLRTLTKNPKILTRLQWHLEFWQGKQQLRQPYTKEQLSAFLAFKTAEKPYLEKLHQIRETYGRTQRVPRELAAEMLPLCDAIIRSLLLPRDKSHWCRVKEYFEYIARGEIDYSMLGEEKAPYLKEPNKRKFYETAHLKKSLNDNIARYHQQIRDRESRETVSETLQQIHHTQQAFIREELHTPQRASNFLEGLAHLREFFAESGSYDTDAISHFLDHRLFADAINDKVIQPLREQAQIERENADDLVPSTRVMIQQMTEASLRLNVTTQRAERAEQMVRVINAVLLVPGLYVTSVIDMSPTNPILLTIGLLANGATYLLTFNRIAPTPSIPRPLREDLTEAITSLSAEGRVAERVTRIESAQALVTKKEARTNSTIAHLGRGALTTASYLLPTVTTLTLQHQRRRSEGINLFTLLLPILILLCIRLFLMPLTAITSGPAEIRRIGTPRGR